MPLPEPNSGESKKDFLSRCMESSTMQSEYPDSDQRYAVCETQSAKRDDTEVEVATDTVSVSRILTKDEDGFERIAFAEILLPDSINVYGDFHTRDSIREFAYGFMIRGFGIDIDHDNIDVSEEIHIIESFIAREGDPDFVEGSWVLGIYVASDEIWDKILSGELNGFSYEAMVKSMEVAITVDDENFVRGSTEPDPFDKHTHDFVAILDDDGRPILGGTSDTNGHSHTISRHTFTDTAFEHSHIFNYVLGAGGR